MAIDFFNRKRPQQAAEAQTAESKLIQQVSRLRDIANSQRKTHLGDAWDDTMRRFYMMSNKSVEVPDFRPQISIPELQSLMFAEASDLSDMNPKIFLAKGPDYQRDKEREQGLQAQWRSGEFNLQILLASLWSLLNGNGYIQVGYDPDYNEGQGNVWIESRDPDTVFLDPFAKSEADLMYCIFVDRMYPDEIRRQWPEQGFRIHEDRQAASVSQGLGGLKMPPGPMSKQLFSTPMTASLDDGRIDVMKCYVRDYSVDEIPTTKEDREKAEAGDNVLAMPKYKPAYPNGRLIVTCQDVVLFDDENPMPLGEMPIAVGYGLPPLLGMLAPPPIRLTMGLQDLAERLYTQTFENAVRLNNGVAFVKEGTGIDLETYGGVPAEVHIIADNSQVPEIKYPPPMPPQMTELPEKLLAKQREIQGYTDTRRGNAPGGNISAPLYDNAVTQSQSMTKLRARFLSQTIRRVARLTLLLMNKFFTSERFFPYATPEGIQTVKWPGPAEDFEKYEVFVDPGSVRPMSASTLRTLVPVLKQMGLIDAKTALEWLELPNPEEILQRLGEEHQQQAQAAILAKASKGKK